MNPPQPHGRGLEKAGRVFRGDHKSLLVESATARAAKHLEKFVGPQLTPEAGVTVDGGSDSHRAHGKIDACRKARGGDDHIEFARLAERFDPLRARRVGEAAVMEGHTPTHQSGEGFSQCRIGLGWKREGTRHGKRGGNLEGHFFGLAADRREKQQGCETRHFRRRCDAGPEAGDVGGNAGKIFDRNLVKRHGAFGDTEKFGPAA